MADDEEAVELACKTILCFIIIYYFSSQMKLIRLLKRITAIITLYTLQTNRVAYRACRARGDGRVALSALVVSTYTTFSYIPKCMG